MRALNPEQALSCAAVLIGLVVGAGVISSSASVPGCAVQECLPQRASQRPVVTLECPSGTLCYQGACVPSCASGSEGVERCESDDDCTSAVRPNCVDRRCSGCSVGERCVPALDICSPIRASDSDGGAPGVDAGAVPGVPPLDGGRIDGSPLLFDAGEEEEVEAPEITHFLTIDVAQRIDLGMGGAPTASITVDVIDVRGTGRVASSTVGDIVFSDGDECAVRRNERYTIRPPTRVDLGVIQLQRDSDAPAGQGRAPGLAADFVATFDGQRYEVTPAISPTMLLLYSTQMAVRGTEITGAGMPPITTGPWPIGMDVPEAFTPDILDLSAASRVALRNIDARGASAFFELDWTKGIPLTGSRVLVTIANDECTLRCTFDEEGAQLRVSSTTIEQFKAAPCNARGVHRVFVDRSAGSVPRVTSNTPTYFVRSVAEIRSGFIGRITF